MTIAEKIKEYRKKNGLSMNKFAILCGLDTTRIFKIERGGNPNLNTIKKICVGMGIAASELMGEALLDMPKSSEEELFINMWRKLNNDQKKLLSALATEFITRYKFR